jgi:hypothetical protein
MTDFHNVPDANSQNVTPDFALKVFGHPDDVLDDPRLTKDEKRTLLASWVSDANSVPHIPSLRQLPDGSIVKVDDILRALKALDSRGANQSVREIPAPLWRRPFECRRGSALRNWSRYGNGADDDDDPPPCPAYAAKNPRTGGGGAFANPEPVAA